VLNEGPCNLLSSPKYYSDDQIKEDEIGRICSIQGNTYKSLVSKPDENTPVVGFCEYSKQPLLLLLWWWCVCVISLPLGRQLLKDSVPQAYLYLTS
jgi:hypothetical protein